MKITREMIKALRTQNGLAAGKNVWMQHIKLAISDGKSGWIERAIGTEITLERYAELFKNKDLSASELRYRNSPKYLLEVHWHKKPEPPPPTPKSNDPWDDFWRELEAA